MSNNTTLKTLYGWFVHTFTASGAVLGVLSLYYMANYEYKIAFILMALVILVDAIDGTMARQIDINKYVRIDGCLMDNMIDFFNYVMIPGFFIMWSDVLLDAWKLPCMIVMVLAACYQFSQMDAKTEDHFFKGFPSYWNIAVFYLFYWQTAPTTNVVIIFVLALLSFIPIKYVYPSRLKNLSNNIVIRNLMFAATVIWGLATIALLFTYPEKQVLLNEISIGYVLLYFGVSLYRTLVPLKS